MKNSRKKEYGRGNRPRRVGSDLNMDNILNDEKWDTDIEEEREYHLLTNIMFFS